MRAVALGVPAERVERELLRADPSVALADETPELGVLVMGSGGRGGLRRAHCPVVVCLTARARAT